MIASDAEMAEVGKEDRLKKQKALQEVELREAFMSRQVAPEATDRINNAVRIAAQNGQHYLQVITFPSSYCSDGGRRINIADPEWPTTLTGFAKDFIRFLQQRTTPSGL